MLTHVGSYNQEEIIGMVSENVTCPKCGHKNSAGSRECVKCGVIFAKFYEFLERKSKEGMQAAAQEEQLEVDATATDKSEVVADDSEPALVKDSTDRVGADAAFAETATEGRQSAEEVEITIDEKPMEPEAVDEAAAKIDLEDDRHPEVDGIVATETLSDVEASEFFDATVVQNVAQASAEREVNLSAAGDHKDRPAARGDADIDSEAERDPSDQADTVGRAGFRENVAVAVLAVETSQPDPTPAGTFRPKPSGTEAEAPAKPVSRQTDVAGQADAEPESVSDDDEVLVLMDLIPETAADSAAPQADGGKDQSENLSAKPESEPAKKIKLVRPEAPPLAFEKRADPEHKSSRDWRSKVKHAMAAKRDLKDIIRAYEGQSIAINYYDSTQIQEAELIFVNNLFFSAFVKNQNLLYSFPLHTIISVAEKIDSGPGGKSAPHAKFPAVITISPPSYV
jgi:hypothetical protein